jgi:hypothetical protein
VQAYIASMEPWQAGIARRVDALVVKHVPGVRKAVSWLLLVGRRCRARHRRGID